MTRVTNGLWWMLRIVFPVAFILMMTLFFAGFKSFYHYEFERNNIAQITGLSQSDMKEAIDHLADYVVGWRADLNHQVVIQDEVEWIYGDREVAHMVDVRHIFDGIRVFLLVYIVALGIFFWRTKLDKLHLMRSLSRFGIWGSLMVIMVLGVLVASDFTQYFVKFHELFFSNDLWLLDPETDVLIQMLPEVFFRDMTVSIMLASLALEWCFALVMGQLVKLSKMKGD